MQHTWVRGYIPSRHDIGHRERGLLGFGELVSRVPVEGDPADFDCSSQFLRKEFARVKNVDLGGFHFIRLDDVGVDPPARVGQLLDLLFQVCFDLRQLLLFPGGCACKLFIHFLQVRLKSSFLLIGIRNQVEQGAVVEVWVYSSHCGSFGRGEWRGWVLRHNCDSHVGIVIVL